ncbi:MAG: HD domain-containing protein [Candidatus Omnitrophica bacterium]|nr:HD domain-containing protein [Candidatus Omnitrophota bacterium]
MQKYLYYITHLDKLFDPNVKVLSLSFPYVLLGAAILITIILFAFSAAISLYKIKTKFLKDIQTKLLERFNALDSEHKILQSLYKRVTSAPALTNFDEKVWHEEEAEFIFELNEQLSLALERSSVAKKLVESIHNFFNVQRTILLLLEKKTNTLKIEHALGLEKSSSQAVSLKDGESISGFILAQNKPILVADLEKDHYFKAMNKEAYLSGNFIGVPIRFQNDSLGILHVCNKKNGRTFSKSDFSFLINVAKVGSIAFKNITLYEQINESYLKAIAALASAIDARDPYTKWHSENVTRYCLAIGKELNLVQHDQEMLNRAALLHDVGKIGIRDNVLLKIDKLTDEEYEQIKMHPLKGDEIVKELSFLKEASALIRHHHERFDGKGYPDKLVGHAIEFGARIIAVADSFDAMTTDRPYRKALTLNEAMADLEKCKNAQFDPEIVDSFIKVLKRTPEILSPPHK